MAVKPSGQNTGVVSATSSVPGREQRAREMLRLRTEQGLTLAAIGARFGVGRERVRQIINRHLQDDRQAAHAGHAQQERHPHRTRS